MKSGKLKGGKVESNPLAGFKPILKTCPNCGKSFTPNINQKYCSVDCRDQAENARERKVRHERNPLVEKICPHCGKSFMQHSVLQIYCSKECRDKSDAERRKATWHELHPIDRVCPVCGKSFVKTTTAQVYCSKECSDAYYRDYFREYRKAYYQKQKAERVEVKVEKTCPVCGKTFMQTRVNQICCSPKHYKYYYNHKHLVQPPVIDLENSSENIDTSKVEIPSTPKKICPVCGKYFNPRHSSQIYCSNKCSKVGEQSKPAYQFKVIEKTCAYCGKTFQTDKYAVKACPECVQKFAEAKKAKLQAQKKKYKCLYCGKITTHKSFCSDTCHDRYYDAKHASEKPQPEAERRDPFKKTIEQWQKEAEQCGLSYGYYRAQIERFGKTFEELVGSR